MATYAEVPQPSVFDLSRNIFDQLDKVLQMLETRLNSVETLLFQVRADQAAGLEKTQRLIVVVDKKVNETVGRVTRLFLSLKEVQSQLPLQK